MDKTSLQLGLTPVGITLLQNKTKVGSFVWWVYKCFNRLKFNVPRCKGIVCREDLDWSVFLWDVDLWGFFFLSVAVR